ncbi:MAG: MmgE/PrpD family protein [Rhizobiaceae bacterium]
MNSQPLAQKFGYWSIGLSRDDIPSDVLVAARRAILDTIGVSTAGLKHAKVKSLKNALVGYPADPVTAAQVYGMAAHIWDFDDTSYTGIMHGSAVIFPVVFALARERNASEGEMIEAFIAGSEVAYTLADICGHNHYFKGWWSTITFGLIGATAAASCLCKLSAKNTAQAIGLAAAAAGGSKSVFGTHGKAYLVGEAAGRAIGFVRAIDAGLSGPIDVFEDSRGYFELLNGGQNVDEEAATLGIRWRLIDPGLLFKTSPVCSAAHAAIDNMAKLMSEANATVEDIVSIEAEVPDLVDISLAYPRPNTPQEAQFSLPYALACAAHHGKVTLDDLEPEAVKSSQKIELMEKVTVSTAMDLSTNEMRMKYPESARLKVSFSNGRTLSGFCGEAYGMPGRPLSDEDLLSKFNTCLDVCGQSMGVVDPESVDLLELASKLLHHDVETLPPIAKEETKDWKKTVALHQSA